MTLYVHSELQQNHCVVKWSTATSSVGGEIKVEFQKKVPEQRAQAEIFALNILLDRYPGKASCIETTHGALRKLLKGANRFSATEMSCLEIKHRKLSISSQKRSHMLLNECLDKVETPMVEEYIWSGIGRPSVASSVGDIEVTHYAMKQFRKLFCPTATLSKLQKFVQKQTNLSSQVTKGGSIYSVYTVPDTKMQFVLAAPEANPSSQRMTTCYSL